MLKFIEKNLLQEQIVDRGYLLKNIPIWFKTYNRLLWDNKLATPIFEVKQIKNVGGLYYPEKKTILISNYYDKTENGHISTLIHEMIHLYMDQINIKDNAVHGAKFKREMDRVNLMLPSNIQVTVKSKVGDLISTKQSKRFGVLIYKDKYGIGITVFDVKLFRNNYDSIKKIAIKHLVKDGVVVTLGISSHPKLLTYKVKRSLTTIESYTLSEPDYNSIIKDIEDKEVL